MSRILGAVHRVFSLILTADGCSSIQNNKGIATNLRGRFRLFSFQIPIHSLPADIKCFC